MKKFITLMCLVALAVGIQSCQNDHQDSSSSGISVDSSTESKASEIYSDDVKYFEGTLGNKPISMTLSRTININEEGVNVQNKYMWIGSYQYLDINIPISITQHESKNKEKVRFDSYSLLVDEERFEGNMSDSTYEGVWSSGGKELKFRVTLKPLPYQFRAYELTKSVPYQKKNISNSAMYSYSIISPVGDYFESDIKKDLFPEINQSLNFQQILNQNYEAYKKDYKSFLDEFYSDLNETSMTQNFSSISSTIPYFISANYICLISELFDYSGGAHGMNYTHFLNFDRSTGRIITPEQLFRTSSKDAIGKIISQYVRKKHNIPPNVPLNEWDESWFQVDEFSYTDNFIITENHIIFHYNTYEVGAYVNGPYEISIPKSALKAHMLTP